ncbi:MAG: tRNA threonylcarbamoyladenosine dehydratase [Clostridiales bacterium]
MRGFVYIERKIKMSDNRFMRFSALIGERDFTKIEKTHAIVFGIGGVGSAAIEALARCGVGTLTMVDFDTIALHNINRQIHALSSTVGRLKVEAMAERIKDINPNVKINSFPLRLTEENIDDFFIDKPDFILDAIDDVPGKIALINYGKEHDIPLISSMGTGNKLNPSQLQVADISKTSVCPLCRSVRKKLREQGIEKGVNVVYSQEIPIKSPLMENNKPIPASSALVPPAAGLLMATWVVNQIRN